MPTAELKKRGFQQKSKNVELKPRVQFCAAAGWPSGFGGISPLSEKA